MILYNFWYNFSFLAEGLITYSIAYSNIQYTILAVIVVTTVIAVFHILNFIKTYFG